MNIIKNAPRMSDGWYYPVADKWWGEIHRNALCGYVDNCYAPHKAMYIEVNINKSEVNDVCNFIWYNINKLQSKFQIFHICDYSYMLRNDCPDIRVIIIEIYAKR